MRITTCGVPALWIALVSAAPGQEEPVQFNRDIRPILAENCFACHGPDARQRKGDLRLDQAAEARKKAIDTDNPARSSLLARITSHEPDVQMPPPDSGKQLTPEEIEFLRRWVRQGAPFERHWSFMSPRRPSAPAVRNEAWIRNPIDRFVLAELDMAELQPAREADRQTWIRRVTLDLTGMPPAVKDVDAFLGDQTEQAYGKVVDRLLASSRYGEHMARFWLDASRYADTNGYQYDLEREQWVWRDWVIHAFNSNMPFDQFTVEQLAGDLLPDSTDQQKLATAFHRNHPITIEGGVIDEEYRTEYVVDRVVTTSTVWLGLTMVCSRCHDHKYDPISQKEFYQFFAFFNQVPEKGNNGFNPKLQAASPLQSGERARIDRQLTASKKRFQNIRADQAAMFSEWALQATDDIQNQWTVTVPQKRRSLGGAELIEQPDRSLLATGKNALTETYELTLPCNSPVYAIRLEALKHKSFVNGSTGRAFNGNFVLSEFQLAASAPDTPDRFEAVTLSSAEADYSQRGYPVSMTIDGRIDATGWAVDGNTKFENRVAVFHPATPLNPDTTAQLRIQMHHKYGTQHHIGRFRISLAGRPVAPVPAEIVRIINSQPDQRTAVQTDRFAEYLARRFGDSELKALVNRMADLRQRRGELDKTPATMVMVEMSTPRKTHLLERGEYDKPGEEVFAGIPEMLPAMPADSPANRLGLARWLTQPNHPLTARVTVNRVWQRLFGTGIVKTVEDFGTQGEWPSHPELLDWLAVEFVESGWDVKRLLKTIVMSATYRQSSTIDTGSRLYRIDPDNRLLGRGPRMRLDAEAIRDSALAASGLLTEQAGGPSVFPYHPPGLWQEINNRPGYSRVYRQDTGKKLYRRSLYTFWKRTVPPPSMSAFDAPEREFCIVRRSRTNTPLQAIVMLHDPQYVEAARHLGQRILTESGSSDKERIVYGFRLCFARPPDERETALLQRVLNRRRQQYRSTPESSRQLLSVGESAVSDSEDAAELAAWTTIGRVLFNLSEFVTKG